MTRGYSTIQRVDRKRIITVISDINEDVANAREIVENLKHNYLKHQLSIIAGKIDIGQLKTVLKDSEGVQ